eukprot:TRINITY_DN18266_c0_g1_i1.p1 TRINITY_DN18266_c0_g1~~TRINITY_DN18266_c0_g1_i1.p1  ORF type:complete len:563 (+),score=109.41 TRINITY_DN18266_c0_g1_i1:198-1886(+)
MPSSPQTAAAGTDERKKECGEPPALDPPSRRESSGSNDRGSPQSSSSDLPPKLCEDAGNGAAVDPAQLQQAMKLLERQKHPYAGPKEVEGVCQFYKYGLCEWQGACKALHVGKEDDPLGNACGHFLRGKCTYRKKCQFEHPRGLRGVLATGLPGGGGPRSKKAACDKRKQKKAGKSPDEMSHAAKDDTAVSSAQSQGGSPPAVAVHVGASAMVLPPAAAQSPASNRSSGSTANTVVTPLSSPGLCRAVSSPALQCASTPMQQQQQQQQVLQRQAMLQQQQSALTQLCANPVMQCMQQQLQQMQGTMPPQGLQLPIWQTLQGSAGPCSQVQRQGRRPAPRPDGRTQAARRAPAAAATSAPGVTAGPDTGATPVAAQQQVESWYVCKLPASPAPVPLAQLPVNPGPPKAPACSGECGPFDGELVRAKVPLCGGKVPENASGILHIQDHGACGVVSFCVRNPDETYTVSEVPQDTDGLILEGTDAAHEVERIRKREHLQSLLRAEAELHRQCEALDRFLQEPDQTDSPEARTTADALAREEARMQSHCNLMRDRLHRLGLLPVPQ